MRIAFDGTTLRPRRTGVGYYSEHLLHHLAAHATSDEVTVLSNTAIETDRPLPPKVRVVTAPRYLPRLVWLQTRAPAALKAIGADVAHFTNGMVPMVSATKTVVTIHDVSLRLYPRYHPPRRVLLNGPLMELAARRADAVITVSESAKSDIIRYCSVDPARVHVVYEAAAPSFAPVGDPAVLDRVRKRYGLRQRVILYVGTIEPRKNLPKLVDAFSQRLRAGDLSHQLVCVGPYGWKSGRSDELIARSQVGEAIVFTGYVPFEDLPALYSLAEMFVYPSMYEGFGLPVIEAMACGAPVITGRTPALAEIGGEASVRLDRLDAGALGDALVDLAGDATKRKELAAAGLARAREFSWARAARETLEIYRTVAARSQVRAAFNPGDQLDWRTAPPEPVEGRAIARGSTSSPRAEGAPAQLGAGIRGSGTDRSFVTPELALTPQTAGRYFPAAEALGPASGVLPAEQHATDVLFGQAYFLRFDPKLWEAQQPYAPLGALYAAAYVRNRGYRVALFDAMLAESVGEWAAALDRHRPRYAVIYEDNFNYLTKMCLLRMRQAALAMIDTAKTRGIVTIVAGSDATDHPGTYLDRGADVVIAGEGEVTLGEVLDALSGPGAAALAHVNGIRIRDGNDRLVSTPPREVIRDLDSLPPPAWDLVQVDRYETLWRARHGYFSMNLATTRGCPYHCNWCAKPIYGQRYTVRSPEHVVEDMAWLKRTYRPDHLWIADDIFGLKPGWITRFADLVELRDAAIPFKCLLRADQVTAGVAGALRRARCQTAWIGAESGSQRVLDAMEKGIRVEQIVDATRSLRQADILVGFFLQFGYPGETRDDIEQTLEMVRRCRPDDIGVSVSYPLPGTPFYERVRAHLGQKQNWVDSDDLALMYPSTYEAGFYRALYALVHSEFRARKAAAALRNVALRPWTIRLRHLHGTATLVKHGARLPMLKWRLARGSRSAAPPSPSLLIPLATPHAAAVPTDQSTLK